MTRVNSAYHHGDLRSACVDAAIELLEQNDTAQFSLRAVAERAGVSPAAPYRHYSNKEALVSAVAAVGFRDLAQHIFAICEAPDNIEDLARVAVGYVRFALSRPALFRLMFSGDHNPHSPQDERQAAASVVSDYLCQSIKRCFPTVEAERLSHALWSLVHGFAVLHLDGQFSTPELYRDDRSCTMLTPSIDDHVHSGVLALLSLSENSR